MRLPTTMNDDNAIAPRWKTPPAFGWPDIAFALAELGAFLIGAVAINEPGNEESTALLLAFGIPLATIQLFLRSFPLPVMLLSITVLSAYHILGGDPVGMVWPLLIPYAVPVSLGYLWPVTIAAVIVTASTIGWRILLEGELAGSVGVGEALGLVTVGLAIAVGEAAWQRSRYAASTQMRIRQVVASAQAEAERQVAQHRLAMAADLHDISGHSLVAIGLHLRIAEESLDAEPAAARAAIGAALDAHQRALHDTTSTVRLLREDSPVPTLVTDHDPLNMDGLKHVADLAGIALDADVALDSELPPERSIAVARILQEALTNTIRHAHARRISLTVREEDTGIALDWRDDGHAAMMPIEAGYGIRGMRERAAHLGGHLDVKRHPEGGVRVTAWIPLDGASP